MRRTWPLLMVALVTLFLAEGQRSLFAALFGLAHDAMVPAVRPRAAILAALPLLAVLAPLLPVARWLDRGAAVAAAALGTAVFRLLMTSPAAGARLAGGMLVVACAAIFLTWAVGHLPRRALAGGVVAGLVADLLLRMAGSSYDLSLQPEWLPAQILLTLALAVAVILWARSRGGAGTLGGGDRGATGGESGEGRLERREGGLRLRGGLALGALLFLDLQVLGHPPIVAHWTGVDHGAAGIMLGVASALALAAALLMGRPTRGRRVTLALVALVTAGSLTGYWADGPAVAGLMAAGHLAALLLLTRALDPASGRRTGVTVAAGFALLMAATALYGVSWFGSLPALAFGDWTPGVFAALGVLLAACFILLPRPAAIPAPPSMAPAVALAGLVAVTAIGMSALNAAGARDADPDPAAAGDALRVAVWDARLGSDADRRFDPGAMADSIRALDADIVALRGTPAGAPAAYGVDLPRWLARRAGLEPRAAWTAAGRPGRAVLARPGLPTSGPERDDPGPHALRVTVAGVPVTVMALTAEAAAGAESARAALEPAGAGPAVVLIAPTLAGNSRASTGVLRAAGFREITSTGAPGAPGHRGAPPRVDPATDRIWVRGLRGEVDGNRSAYRSYHGVLVATLHILRGGIRSTEANDLQTP